MSSDSNKIDSWLPKNFIIPDYFYNEFIRLEPLTSKDAQEDFLLIMEPENRKHIEGSFIGYDDTWPREDFTFEENLEELKLHEVLFQDNKEFNYKIIRQIDNKYIGCFYILPSDEKDVDARVYMWVTKDAFDNGKDTQIFQDLKKWIEEKWTCFNKVDYPGRDIGSKE